MRCLLITNHLMDSMAYVVGVRIGLLGILIFTSMVYTSGPFG